jgi:hypothetical protein
LMNGIIGKSREGKFSAGEQDFHFIRARQFAEAFENIGGFFLV